MSKPMRTCFNMDPLTLDPRKNGDVISSEVILMLYDGLTELLQNGEVELSLAQSYQVSDDGCKYIFHLRKAFWSDGNPITAHDFEYSWKKSLDPTFPSSCPHLFFTILNAEAAAQGKMSLDEVGIHVINDRTLEIRLEHPVPYFLALVSCCNFFPIPKHVELANPTWESQMAVVSSGPFTLSKWEKRKEICVAKNPFYWDEANTTLDKMVITITDDEYETLTLFENQEVDWLSTLFASVPPQALHELILQKKVEIIPTATTAFCTFNINLFPFHNTEIRKAFSYGINRIELVENTVPYNAVAAKRLVSPNLDNQNLEILPPFNPAIAKWHLQKGLTELGILKKGNQEIEKCDLNLRLFLSNITLSYENAYRIRTTAIALQKQWSKSLGFQVKLQPLPYKQHMERIYKGDFNLSLNYCAAHYSDPLSILDRFKYKNLNRNFPKFESPVYIDLLNRSQRESPRELLLNEAEMNLLSQIPLTPLYHFNCPILTHPTVSGVRYSPIGGVQFKRARFNPAKSNKYKVAVS